MMKRTGKLESQKPPKHLLHVGSLVPRPWPSSRHLWYGKPHTASDGKLGEEGPYCKQWEAVGGPGNEAAF